MASLLRNNITVSGDDFGLNEAANKNILDLIKLGKIKRVAVLVDGKIEKREIEKILDYRIKLDIHLDSVEQISHGQLAKQNNWKRLILFSVKYCLGKISTSKMEKDWLRQIEQFKEIFGRYPDGLNSHQHIHYFPAYFKMALKLCNNYGINYIRFGKKGFLGSNTFIKIILLFLRKINHSQFIMFNCHSSDYMVSLDWIGNINNFINNLPSNTTELVCHPERKEEFEIIKKYF